VQILTSDIASASQVSTNTADIAALQAAYAGLTQSDIVIVSGALPSSGQQQNVIYRQPDPDHTPPQFYSDYMWNSSTWVLMATYNNAIDAEPIENSHNLVESGGVYNEFAYVNGQYEGLDDNDLSISDDNGNDIVQFGEGHVKTKNFSSKPEQSGPDGEDLAFTDDNGYDIVQFINGHIKTKNFDSSTLVRDVDIPMMLHIVMTGQSMSVGYGSSPVLGKVNSKRAFMFDHVRSFDFGYALGVTRNDYNPNQDEYDLAFYELHELQEQSNYGDSAKAWTGGLANNEYETPCSGVIEGILLAYQKFGFKDTPFYTLSSCSGVGGVGIQKIQVGQDIFERIKKDIRYGMLAANKMGVAYKPIIVWIQGEHDSDSTSIMSVAEYKNYLTTFHSDIEEYCQSLGINKIDVFSYQTSDVSGINVINSNPTLAQMELDSEDWFHITYPNYQLAHKSDYTHLTNLSSRYLGNMIGDAIAKSLEGYWETLKISAAYIDGTKVIVVFNKEIAVDPINLLSPTGLTQEQLDWRVNSMGFRAIDDNDTDLLVSVSKISDTSVEIVCSAAPTKIAYGFTPPTGAPIGGTIREKQSIKGFNDAETYRYMPVQVINVSTRHNFSQTY
jgi:hypothetical protein